MKYYSIKGRESRKALRDLSTFERYIYDNCKEGRNFVRVLKLGRPYGTGDSKIFYPREEIISAIHKLEKLGLIEGR